MVNYTLPTRAQELALYNNMKQRCNNKKGYENCVIGKTWEKDHEKLYTWYRNNYYTLPDGEPINIDKDILIPNNRIYSEDTCLLVPERINKFFINIHGTKKNGMPVGVTLDKKSQKYKASIYKNKKSIKLGTYGTPQEAHDAWRKAKIEHLLELIEHYKDIVPSEVTEAMMQWVDFI